MNKKVSNTSNIPEQGHTPAQESVWIQQAQQGDAAAFELLVKAYQPRLFSVIAGYTKNVDEAEEICQLTWIKVWRKLDSFKGDARFFTWLYRVGMHQCMDVRRKAARRSAVHIEEEDALTVLADRPDSGTLSRPDREAQHADVKEAFYAALETLSPEHRAVMLLREIEGLSYDEIAVAVRCRKGTVMSRLYHARRQMQAALKEYV